MSTSVPNSISFDELESFLEAAPTDAKRSNDPDSFTKDELIQLASDICDEACEKYSGPMVHKTIAMTILSRMIHWHTSLGLDNFEAGDQHTAVCWLRDAGKLQAALALIASVELGSDDFTVSD